MKKCNKNQDLEDKLKQIDLEDFVLIIFIALFIMKMWSNLEEREYRIYNDIEKKKRYHYINEFTFIVAFLIYAYYVYRDYNNEEKNHLVMFANILSLVTLIIFIYLEVTSND